MKVAGCCVHVATLIYYLAYAKYYAIRIPADYLNAVFVNTDLKEEPNKPRIVRRKRCIYTNIPSSQVVFPKQMDVLEPLPISSTCSNTQNHANRSSIQIYNFLREFKARVPKWGARISYLGQENVYLADTCSIDYFLLALWHLFKNMDCFEDRIVSHNPELGLLSEDLLVLVNLIDVHDWDRARESFLK